MTLSFDKTNTVLVQVYISVFLSLDHLQRFHKLPIIKKIIVIWGKAINKMVTKASALLLSNLENILKLVRSLMSGLCKLCSKFIFVSKITLIILK